MPPTKVAFFYVLTFFLPSTFFAYISLFCPLLIFSFFSLLPFIFSLPSSPFLFLSCPPFICCIFLPYSISSSSPFLFSSVYLPSLLFSLVSFPFLYSCSFSFPLLLSCFLFPRLSLPAVSQWRVNKGEVMRAILSEPHPSHCHLIPTAVTVCTQACAFVHVYMYVLILFSQLECVCVGFSKYHIRN